MNSGAAAGRLARANFAPFDFALAHGTAA